MKKEDVIKEMKNLGVFSREALDEITQEVIDDGIKNAVELPPIQWPLNVRPMCSIYDGNRFRIVNGMWYWEDKVGSMCGRERTWKWKPKPGGAFRQVGKCPQGYVWYEIFIPA